MSSAAGRRRLLFTLAALGFARAGAQQADARQTAEGVGGRGDPGLRRLEQILETQLARGTGALPLPWSETILKPDTARFVWRAHSLPAPHGGGVFRVAIDPPTRWYYIGQVGTAGAPLTLYGPIEESSKGRFIDALASARAESPAASRAAKSTVSPKTSPSKKSDSKSKPKPKPSTKVKA